MPKFTTRVELHDENARYADLDAAMEAYGFKRTIEGARGVIYRLPTAEYDYSSLIATRDNVLERAQEATATVSSDCSILITESKGRTLFNLRKA
ncbi:MAG: hypothetical protein ACRYG5_18640 [Janthinobacterium lividum]